MNRKKLTCSTPSCPIYTYIHKVSLCNLLCLVKCISVVVVVVWLLLFNMHFISLSLSLSSTAWQTKSLLPTYRRSQSAVSQWRPQLRQQQQQHQLIATSSFPSSARSPALLPCQLVLRICLSLYLLQHPLQIKFISQLPVSQAHTHTHRHI